MAARPLDLELGLGRHGTGETPFVALTSKCGESDDRPGEPAARDRHQKCVGSIFAKWNPALYPDRARQFGRPQVSRLF